MPGRNGSDGSIIIDTGLDTKGFDKGSKELFNAINSLTKEVNQLGKTLQTTFSGYGKSAESSNTEVQQLEDTVKSLEAKVQSLNATIAELEAKLETVGGKQLIDPASLTDAGAAAGSASEQIATLQARIEELEGVAADLQAQLGQIDAQSVSPSFSMDQPKQAVTTLEKDIDKLNASLKALDGLAGAAIAGDVKSLGKFDAQAERAQDALDGLKQRLEAFGSTKFETDDYKWVQAEITKADNALQKLLDRQAKMQATGVRENSRAYRALEYDIEQAKARLDDLIATRQIYEDSGNAVISGVDTEQFEQYRTALEDIEGQLTRLQDEVDAAFQPPHVERWNEMVTLSGMIRGAFSSAFSAIRNGALMVGQAVTHPIQAVDRALGAVTSAALRAAGALLNMVRGAVVSALTRLASAAKKAAVHLAQMAGNAVVGGMKRLASFTLRAAKAVLTLGRNAKKSKSGLKSGLMTILKYGLGIRSVYALVNKLRAAIKEGFGNLAQYSDEVNKSVSSVKSALSQFKNSIAAAFAPIVNAAAPAVTNLIKLLTAATEKFGQFTAALTGQKTFIRAKEVQEDYAASLKKTAKEAKDASRQLAGFDELEILKDNSSKDKDDEEKKSPADMFEEIPVGDGPKNLADMIKAAWAEADFTDIGRMIGDKLKAALDLIPWESIKSTASKVGKSVATLLNGALETPGLFTGLGRTLAEALNTAFSFLNSFAWKFHWGSLGNALMDMIEGACDHLDWKLIDRALQGLASGLADFLNTVFGRRDVFEKVGATLGNALNAVVDSALTFFRKVDFAQVGSTIAAGLNSMIKTINWSSLGALFAEYLNALVNTVYGVVTTFDWKGAASALATGINSFIQNIDWKKIGKTFSESVKGLLTGLVTLLEEVDWYQLGQNVADMLAEVDWSGIIGLLFEGLGAALGGLAAFLWGLIEDAWNSVVDWWHDTAFEDGQFTIMGLLNGILDAVKNIGAWLKEHVIDPIVNGFKDAFGIHSPSTVMAEIGKFLMEGLFKGLLDNIKGIGKWVKKNVLKPIQDAFKKARAAIEVGVQLIKDGWENLKGFVGDKLRAFVSLVKSGWTNLSDFAGNTITAFVSLVRQGWDTLSGFVGSVVAVAVTLVKRGWAAISDFVGTAVTTVVSLAKSGWETISGFVGTAVTTFITLARSGWESISGFIGSAVSVSVSLIKNGWDKISAFVGTAVTVAVSVAKEGWATLTGFVGDAVTVAISLAKSGWTTISGFVGTAVTTAITLAKNGWTTIADFVGTAVTTVVSLAKSGWKTVSGFVGDAVTVAVSLAKSGWTTITGFVGTAVTTVITLAKNAWTTIADFVGTAVTTVVSLAKSGWETISGFVGTAVTAAITLAKSGWTTIADFVGTTVTTFVSLAKSGWESISGFVGTAVTTVITLAKNAWTTIADFVGTSVTTVVSLAKSGWDSISGFVGNAVSVAVTLTKKLGSWADDAWNIIQSAGKTFTATLQMSIEKGKTWGTEVWSAIQNAGKTLGSTLAMSVEKGRTWVSDAWQAATMTADTVVRTVEAAVKKTASSSNWVEDAWKAATMTAGTVSRTVEAIVKKATSSSNWVTDAWTAATMKAETVQKTVKAAVDKHYTWVPDAWTAANVKTETVIKTVKAAVDKYYTWIADAWKAAQMEKSSVTKTVEATVRKSTGSNGWVDDAWTVVKTTAGNIIKSVTANVTKGTWYNEAFTAAQLLGGTIKKTLQITVSWDGDRLSEAWKVIGGKALGGILNSTGLWQDIPQFASGGRIMSSGRASWWDSVQKYAAGTARAHGSLFVAGEAGPEVVGHINGRTEVLNKSQIASAIYSAVLAGMETAVNGLGQYLYQRMGDCANAIIGAILAAGGIPIPLPVSLELDKISGESATLPARLAALANSVSYSVPAFSTGTVMPYAVKLHQESITKLQELIDASNDELAHVFIQTITAQTTALVAALQELAGTFGSADNSGAIQRTIDEINRRTQMYSRSPLKV